MRNDANFFESAERKENFFLPSFKLKSRNNSRHSKTTRKEEKTKQILNQEQVKALCEQIGGLNGSAAKAECKKDPIQIKIRNFRFKFRNTPPTERWNKMPLGGLLVSRIQRRERGTSGDGYKFMLTGANFAYLNDRILENDSSNNSFGLDLPSLDAKYTNMVQDMKGKEAIYIKSSQGFGDADYIKRRIIYKSK